MPAIGYARISEDDKRQGRGVARQQADIEKLCARNHWQLIDTIIENDVSASRYSRKPRPGYQQVLHHITSGVVDKVAVYDLDRLLRQPRELEDLIDIADRTPDLRIVNVTGETRLDTADGRFIARILVAKAAKESDDTSRRVTRQKLDLAEAGRPSGGGRRPIGFAANRIDHDPVEAAAIQHAAQAILNGSSLTAAARTLVDTGVLAGPPHYASVTLKRLLLSPRVAGLRQHHGDIVGQAAWQPIIDRETQQQLRSRLDRPGRYSVPRTFHLLTGLAVCECGARLWVEHKRQGRVYVCKKARGGCGRLGVNAERLEQHVRAWVASFAQLSKNRRAAQRHFDGADTSGRETELRGLIEADEARLTELAAQVGELKATVNEWSAMRQPILDRIEDARIELARLQQRPVARIDFDQLALIWDLAKTVEQQRDTLRYVIGQVRVSRVGKAQRRFTPDRVEILPPWAPALSGPTSPTAGGAPPVPGR